jgi:hypothetical protein
MKHGAPASLDMQPSRRAIVYGTVIARPFCDD